MGNNLAADVAYAASRLTRVAVTAELAVYQRAVTSADPRGQVCPFTGGTGFQALAWGGSDLSAQRDRSARGRIAQGQSAQSGPSAQGPIAEAPSFGVLRSDIAARNSAVKGASSVMHNVSLSKPRTGYCAISGTG